MHNCVVLSSHKHGSRGGRRRLGPDRPYRGVDDTEKAWNKCMHSWPPTCKGRCCSCHPGYTRVVLLPGIWHGWRDEVEYHDYRCDWDTPRTSRRHGEGLNATGAAGRVQGPPLSHHYPPAALTLSPCALPCPALALPLAACSSAMGLGSSCPSGTFGVVRMSCSRGGSRGALNNVTCQSRRVCTLLARHV